MEIHLTELGLTEIRDERGRESECFRDYGIQLGLEVLRAWGLGQMGLICTRPYSDQPRLRVGLQARSMDSLRPFH